MSALDHETLLLEIGTEELPPKSLARLGRSLRDALADALRDARLLVDGADPASWFASPRRLAVKVPGVRTTQPDSVAERRGPAVTAAFGPDGEPTRAALGFARSCGVDVSTLERLTTEKGEWLAHREARHGESAAAIVPDLVEASLRKLPVARRMRWGAGEVEFVRPVHWVVLLHGEDVLPAVVLSVPSGRATRGHRVHGPDRLDVAHADDYPEILREQGSVVANFAERRTRVRESVAAIAARYGARVGDDDTLLDEVTGLVEWPHALEGAFDEAFLEVPPEVLVSSMRDHQKYFPLVDGEGRLLPRFVTVANLRLRDDSRVRAGNERVLRARLADARFFYDADRAARLETRVPELDRVMYHRKLGSLGGKRRRLEELSARVAAGLGADGAAALRAATLAKADLVTDMVGEFPELQGTMGRYYAAHDGEDAAVACAVEEHYLPRHAGDALPATPVGTALALADRLDTLVGVFAAGEEPSGDRDPLGLRRAALGVLRILIEGEFALDLGTLVESTVEIYRADGDIPDPTTRERLGGETATRVFDFVMERLRAYYASDFGADELAAVMARRPSRPLDFDRRLHAVQAFRKMSEADSLAAANKRIRNILRQAGFEPSGAVDGRLLEHPAERHLAEALAALAAEIEPMIEASRYTDALSRLAALREPVDRFFDDVLVMAPDPRVRDNRLGLLHGVSECFGRIAEIGHLQPEQVP